jgi:hypothetical protein
LDGLAGGLALVGGGGAFAGGAQAGVGVGGRQENLVEHCGMATGVAAAAAPRVEDARSATDGMSFVVTPLATMPPCTESVPLMEVDSTMVCSMRPSVPLNAMV